VRFASTGVTRSKAFGGSLALLAASLLLGAVGTASAKAGVPAITFESVSHVTQTDATLKAEIDPGGLETHYEIWLEYKVCQNAPPGDVECEVIATEPRGAGTLAAGDLAKGIHVRLKGLSAGYTYTYWVVASNSEGEGEGAHQRFTTQDQRAPAIESESITREGTSRGATLKARIDADGLPTTYEFWVEYQPCLHLLCELLLEDPEPRGGGTIPGDGTVNVSLPHSGLTGDSYLYWVEAANADGSVTGPGQEFPAL
jgi:hypothetical protein